MHMSYLYTMLRSSVDMNYDWWVVKLGSEYELIDGYPDV